MKFISFIRLKRKSTEQSASGQAGIKLNRRWLPQELKSNNPIIYIKNYSFTNDDDLVILASTDQQPH
ncbi:hypothetical protein [Acinetobacter sp.]|uniref:hypothetical protein n=1 Tax=Acinetobacter sp. TaxID=472 RepID=UPI002FCC8ABE